MDLFRLKEPTLSEFLQFSEEFTNKIDRLSVSSQNLAVYSTLLESNVIHSFSTNNKGMMALVAVFSTPAGLGCLVSHLRSVSGSQVDDILRLTAMVLRDADLPLMLEHGYSETANLIWGSRILNTASLRDFASDYQWLGDLKPYATWLANRMIVQNIADPKLFDRGVKLGAPKEFVAPFVAHPKFLTSLLSQLRPSQQEFILCHALIPLLSSSPPSTAAMLIELNIDPEMMCRVCYKLPVSVAMIRAAIVLARETTKLYHIVTQLFREWSNPINISTMALLNQQALTQLLIGATLSLTTDEAIRLSHTIPFTEGISNRLLSTSTSIRELGTLVGEVYAKRGGSNLEFGMNYSGYDWWVGRDELGEIEPQICTEEEEKIKNVLNFDAETRNGADSDDGEAKERDSDDEDSEEEVDPPYYLKDLLAYLMSEKYPEVFSALENGGELITRKAKFGTEVPQYAEEILNAACGLNDKFSITKFSEMRQSILNAVLIADPHQAQTVVRMFITGDWSLAQRQSLLAAMAYAAYELASGNTPSKGAQLPARLHNLFITDNEKKQLEGAAKPSKNLFSSVANKFFFPLLAAQPPLRKSSYDALVYAQWLRTLGLVVYQAYPTRFMPEMVSEMWSLLSTLIKQSALHESVVLDSVYASLSMIISVGRGIIVQSFPSEIGSVFDDLVAGLQSVDTAGPQTVQGGKAAAAQLAEMIQQINNKILNT